MSSEGCATSRTTTRSSRARATWRGLLLALTLVWGCGASTSAAGFFELDPASPRQRADQVRYFETDDELELLSASAATLQDLGFHIDECVRELGFLSARKERSARTRGQALWRDILLVLTFGLVLEPVDLHQQFAATLVARPIGPSDSDSSRSRHEVRVSFYRVVWKGPGHAGDRSVAPGEQRMEMIRDPRIYQQFFARLSKGVFLEAHTL